MAHIEGNRIQSTAWQSLHKAYIKKKTALNTDAFSLQRDGVSRGSINTFKFVVMCRKTVKK